MQKFRVHIKLGNNQCGMGLLHNLVLTEILKLGTSIHYVARFWCFYVLKFCFVLFFLFPFSKSLPINESYLPFPLSLLLTLEIYSVSSLNRLILATLLLLCPGTPENQTQHSLPIILFPALSPSANSVWMTSS